MDKRTCNQCHKELVDLDAEAYLLFCKNPECPCYALLQVPLEYMPKEENRGAKIDYGITN